MIDFHSHILPKMDDGSKSVEESIEMLSMLNHQGVDRVIATSHFYPNHEPLERFLERRQVSFEKLNEALTDNCPQISLGAEVRFYDGISRLKGLEELRICGNKLLLLEMPFSKWTDYTVKELVELSCSSEYVIVLAHIERYMSFQKAGLFESLRENGILMQVNASLFKGYFSKKSAFKLFDKGLIHFIGSDCHNLSDRPPNIEIAYNAIEKKLGREFRMNFEHFSKSLFKEYILT